MLRHGHSLKLSNRQRSQESDPLAGLLNRLRLQTYKLGDDQIQYTRPCTVISGANSAPANARYYRLDDYIWQTDDGSRRLTFNDVDLQWVLTVNDNRYYVSGTGYDYTFGPAAVTVWFEDEVGSSPTPTSSFVDEAQYMPIGIPEYHPVPVAIWSDAITSTGQATQGNALQRFYTDREAGRPVLVSDGTDDCMNTPIASNVLNTRGTMFAVFCVNDGQFLNGHHVIGSSGPGASLSSNTTNSQWGLYKTAGWGTRLPIATPPNKWVAFAASWDGIDFRYHCISQGVNEAKTGTLSSGFTTARTEPLSIGGRYTNTGVLTSWFPGRFIAVGLDDRFLSATNLQRLAEYGATLFPPS